ncbi:MAG: GAF domain-containing protein [Anaerolineales bacterium]
MTTNPAPPAVAIQQKRYKGSLTGTLVRTLLIFTFIPLALMAGAAYFRARTLLRDQAISQSENLLSNQLKVINGEITAKQKLLEEHLNSSSFANTIELSLHANPQNREFNEIRQSFINEFQPTDTQNNKPAFDQFFLVGKDGVIKVSSNADWQGMVLDTSEFENMNSTESHALYGLSPIYENELILVTAVNYQTQRGSTLGTLVGITEKENLQQLLQPLNGLSPFANTYLILAKDQVVASNPSTGEFTKVKASPDQDKLATSLSKLIEVNSNETVAIDLTSPDGKASLAQLKWFSGMQSGVVLEISNDKIYGQVTSLVPFTILLALLTLAGIGLAITIGTRRVIRPLQSLSEITRKFAGGDWNLRADVHSNDEVGVLANSFNFMANQISEIYRSLEQKVEERTRQIQTASEVAQSITTISSLDEMLKKTTELLVQQFGYQQASVYMLDRGGKFIDFKAGSGSATNGLKEKNYRIEVGSPSIIGWVIANNQPRIASDVTEDPLHLRNELLPDTRSEAAIPISLGSLVLGVLDVQSTQSGAFSKDGVVMLQTLASQIATAVQTAGLIETSQVNFEELERLYRSSRLIAEANSEADILNISGQILSEVPYPTVLLRVERNQLHLISSSDSTRNLKSIDDIPASLEADYVEINSYLSRGTVITISTEASSPKAFRDLIKKLDLISAAFVPVKKQNELIAVIMIGSRNRIFTNAAIQLYSNLADLTSITLEKADAVQQTERHLREVESLASINEIISSASDLPSFFRALLVKIQQIIGDYNMIVALYDERSNTISVPFSYENKQIISIDPFPLGEGLTSILIRTRQPLMLVENTEQRANELGAKVAGKPARSWMGAPMLVQNAPVGALIIQDLENEYAFDENDLKFFTALASQVAGVINNVRLLGESQSKAIQIETAAEIARDISGSLNLDELLIKAVNFIRERFDFYHASIFLHDIPGEFAMIREATGEAGTQMKRAGYKIGVGSKSIVGFVSGKGEQLVVNDTSKDATYYANPLLPDTRAEAAIPLKVGDRIVGVLDIQSTKPYSFSEDNLRSLQILADQLAVAVVNTELFAETQEHLSQHRLLHHITTTAASGTTLEEALESAVSGLQVTLGGDRVTILLADRDKKVLEVKASMGYSDEISRTQIGFGSGITGWVAEHRRTLRVRDVNIDPRYIQASSNTRSELAIPLIYRNELLGVLNVESEQVDAYTENDEEMLGTLGGSLAAIIANARLLEQIRVQAERERLINEVAGKIRRSTDIQSILMTTASEVTRITGSRYARINIKPTNSEES